MKDLWRMTTAFTASNYVSGPPPRSPPHLPGCSTINRIPASLRYHSWLTPEEFGTRFGLSANDLAGVKDWLERQGLRIDAVGRSRTFITFSATAGQLRDTFQTEIRQYRAGGRRHFASAHEARIPVDLAPLLFTMTGLDDFGSEDPPVLKPAFNGAGGQHSLAPGDLATIYNLTPIFERGINGAGQRIAIAGRADIHMEDVQNYRSQFGLPKNDPQRILVPGYPNPGNEEDNEALLDLEVAGASAPNATLIYVFAPSAWSAVLYAIDENLAPILSTSFGGCETNAFLLATVDLLLERMPAGMQQLVGQTGWQLSQGERSRVFIARALLQGANLVILDESFAALDPENLRHCPEWVLKRSETLMVVANHEHKSPSEFHEHPVNSGRSVPLHARTIGQVRDLSRIAEIGAIGYAKS